MRTRGERQRRQAIGGEQRALMMAPFITDPKTLSVQVWDAASALSIPAVGKALHMLQLISTMPLELYKGVKPLPRPRLLEQPDLTMAGTTRFVQVHLQDWLLSGNACHLVTARDSYGQPAAVRWRPASQWAIKVDSAGEIEDYYLNGRRVENRDDVVHVARGSEGLAHSRGIGIVEQYLRSLDRVALEEESERQNLRDGSVPSVAVITPQSDLDDDEIDEAADTWMTKLSGPGRRPAILPNGTQVIPLTWSASEQQMIAARQMSLTDVANMTGLDDYYLGSKGGSHTYRSPGPKWLELVRIALSQPMRTFEDAWSLAWVPRGKTVRFNPLEFTRDDLQTSIATIAAARAANLMTYEEGRIYLGFDPDVPEPKGEPVAPPIATETDTTTEEDQVGDEPAGEDTP